MEEKIEQKGFKTHVLLPIIFILTTMVAVMFLVVDDFLNDMSPFVIWLYFGVALSYISVAIVDLFINKERSNKNKVFVIVMAILSFIAVILYMIFYLIAKGRM